MRRNVAPREHPLVTLAMSVGLLAAWSPDQAGATAYECRSHGGSSVFTNDPRGFQECRAISTSPAPVPAAEPDPAGNTSAATADAPLLAVDQPADGAAPAPLADAPDLAPDQAARPDPEYGPAPTVVAPSAQTCARGVNRLNPFGGGPCDPAAVEAPIRMPSKESFR